MTKPHGVRGGVKVRLYYEGSETLRRVKTVLLRLADGSELEAGIEQSSQSGKAAVLLLHGFRDREAAERLRGAEVRVPRESLPALEEGEYYLCDLVGAQVVAPDGIVGRVVEVRAHPSVDAVVIRAKDGSLVEQPLTAPWLERVDADEGVIELSSTEGFF